MSLPGYARIGRHDARKENPAIDQQNKDCDGQGNKILPDEPKKYQEGSDPIHQAAGTDMVRIAWAEQPHKNIGIEVAPEKYSPSYPIVKEKEHRS